MRRLSQSVAMMRAAARVIGADGAFATSTTSQPLAVSHLHHQQQHVRWLHASSPACGGHNHSDDEDEAHAAALRRQQAAQEVMEDPMARLMASRGMPLGFNVQQKVGNAPAAGSRDPEVAALTSKPTAEPAYDMEALDEIFDRANPQARQQQQQQAAPEASERQQPQQGASIAAATAAAAAAAAAVAGRRGGGVRPSGSPDDAWGTTRQSPAAIARKIAESNAGVAPDFVEEQEDEGDDNLRLSPAEEKYRTLEQMSADIKNLDEVFEVLASVPWLDEGDLQQKELKGVAMHGLLGTLEEVGFDIRTHVQRIWAGERDDGIILQCTEAKDQAALISILFHTKKIEEQYGAPPK